MSRLLPAWTSLPGIPSATPTHKPGCSPCILPNTRKYRHDPYAPFYRIGDIIIIRDSVHAPIDALSSGSAYAPIDAAFSGVSQTILQAATALPDTSECKARPGIVVDKDWRNRPLGREPWPEKVMVCLLTSYGGIHTSKFLPAILKEFFAVPVSRHCETITSDFHLHTYPEWQKENAWLIAYPFTSTGEVLGRWEWRNSRGRSEEDGSFKVAAPRDLEAICDARLNKWTEWQLLYGDEFQDRCEETYDLFVDQEAWAQRICQMLPDRIDEISGDVVSRRSAESTDNETDDDASRVSDGDIGTTRMEQAESVERTVDTTLSQDASRSAAGLGPLRYAANVVNGAIGAVFRTQGPTPPAAQRTWAQVVTSNHAPSGSSTK